MQNRCDGRTRTRTRTAVVVVVVVVVLGAVRVSSYWPIWLIGCVALLVAGFGAALAPRWRARAYARQVAWSAAQAAITSAAISRDAATTRVTEAEQLLARAETIAARRGGPSAARAATGYAERADRLWRAAAGG